MLKPAIEEAALHDHDEHCHDGSCRKLDIDYPCPWNFTIIGTNEEGIQQAVGEVLGDREHELVPSRESSSGKYVSLKLTTTVSSEEQRNELSEQLGSCANVKIVI